MKQILTAILITAALSVRAGNYNDSVDHRIGVSFGLGSTQMKDENLNSKVHSGLSLRFGFENRRIRKNLSDFGFEIIYARLRNTNQMWSNSDNIQGQMYYYYQFRLVNKRSLRYYIGPGNLIQYNVSYYPGWDDRNLYHADFWSVGVKTSLECLLQKSQKLLFDLEVPIVSIISRPPLNRVERSNDFDFGPVMKSLHSNVEAGSFERNTWLRTHIEYSFATGTRVRQCAFFEFSFNRMRHTSGYPYWLLQYHFGLKAAF